MSGFQWHRIEPHARSENLEEGLQARIADPLWMLARQWQVGEFRGEDAASPVHVRLAVHSHRIRTLRNDARGPRAPAEPLDGRPLEPLVESERVVDGPAMLRLAVDAGTQFLRRLEAAGLGFLRDRARLRFPLEISSDDVLGVPEHDIRRLQLMARRGLDGRKVARASLTDLLSAAEGSWAAALDVVFDAWRREYASQFVEPSATGDTWVDGRLEYSFSIGAPVDRSELVMEAREYSGGHLDWYAFDVASGDGATHGLSPSRAQVQRLQVLPVPLAYAGMPASRWWELEEGSVYFGGIAAGPADLGRLVLAEFATVYSDDWFIVPVRVPTGTVSRVSSLDVLDTFGQVHHVAACAVYDQMQVGQERKRPWAFFELAGDRSAQDGKPPWLLLAPTLATSLNGKALEHVTFVRDEAANLAWGIEERIEMPTGRSLRRRQQWTTDRPVGQSIVDTAVDVPWRYRLQTPVPPNWIPFVPERQENGHAMRLRRGRMQSWQEMDPGVIGAKGRILDPGGPLRLFEEEVPRGGIEVTRAWQMARGADGASYLWMARRKRPGRGERGSGLEFDRML